MADEDQGRLAASILKFLTKDTILEIIKSGAIRDDRRSPVIPPEKECEVCAKRVTGLKSVKELRKKATDEKATWEDLKKCLDSIRNADPILMGGIDEQSQLASSLERTIKEPFLNPRKYADWLPPSVSEISGRKPEGRG